MEGCVHRSFSPRSLARRHNSRVEKNYTSLRWGLAEYIQAQIRASSLSCMDRRR